MKRTVRHHPQLRPSALTLALLAAFGAAAAELPATEASVTVGGGLIDGDRADRAWFGQYNGLRDDGSLLLLDLSGTRRDAAAGAQLDITGSNLLGSTRELWLSWRRQGDWKLGLSYGEAVRHDPYTVRSGLLGAGGNAPQVVVLPAGDPGADLGLKLERTALGLSLWKAITPDMNLELSLLSEDKEGARLFGIGVNCPSTVAPGCRGATGANTGWALLMLPEPIQSNHSQVALRLNFAADRLRLNAGYHGSFYNNRYSALQPSVPGSLNNGVGTLLPLNTGLQALLNLPLALPPDNQAHQIDVAGTYALTETTQARFKLALARALQHQDFAAAGWTDAPAGVADLGGRVDTTLVQLGLSARPAPGLSLLADLRYEDKDDRTPIALYNVEGTATYTNARHPLTRTRGKLQATYQIAAGYRGLLALDHERIDRGVFTATSAVAGITALRQQTDETTARAELRRLLAEDFSAAISLSTSRRDGSNWLKPNSGTGVTEVADPADPALGFGSTGIFMPTLADRQRDKLKLSASWQPSEALSLQFVGEVGRDDYDAPSRQGLKRSGNGLAALDLDYTLSEKWRVNAYVSLGSQDLHQSRAEGYILSFRNRSTNLGLGFSGQPAPKWGVGGSLSWADDRNVYRQRLDGSAPPDSVALLAATGGLPDIVFRQTALKLFGRYAIDQRSSARIELVHQRSRQRDWTWSYDGVPFAYADGSTVWQQPNQQVTLISVSYTYRWQ